MSLAPCKKSKSGEAMTPTAKIATQFIQHLIALSALKELCTSHLNPVVGFQAA